MSRVKLITCFGEISHKSVSVCSQLRETISTFLLNLQRKVKSYLSSKTLKKKLNKYNLTQKKEKKKLNKYKVYCKPGSCQAIS